MARLSQACGWEGEVTLTKPALLARSSYLSTVAVRPELETTAFLFSLVLLIRLGELLCPDIRSDIDLSDSTVDWTDSFQRCAPTLRA